MWWGRCPGILVGPGQVMGGWLQYDHCMPSDPRTRDFLVTGRQRADWTTVLCDSLEKVFPDQAPRPLDPTIPQHVFRGEEISFQIAILPPSYVSGDHPPEVSADVTAPDGLTSKVSAVDLIPATFLAFDEHDEGYLRDTAGLYPDLLRPLHTSGIDGIIGQWRGVWVDLRAAEAASAGPTSVVVTLQTVDGTVVGRHELTVVVLDATLPALEMVNTHWFHCDGLATYYGSDVWSEPHWTAVDNFMAEAAKVQINSILTPVWTPSLDTARDHYRLTTQLLQISQDPDGTYGFDFTRLRRWIALARKNGLRHLEIAHLFTQWGATSTPAIVVERDGRTERVFGWDVAATDPAYRTFLTALLPELRVFLDTEWGLDKVIWHVSDEPHGDQADTYLAARHVIDDLLEGCTIVDALSDYDLYTSGTVPVPVAATDAAQPFLDGGVDPLWLYYCVGQHRDVANRFFAMPSSRNRALGLQLFHLGAAGFLHWGFNFYNSRNSLRPIDPFRHPDADNGFPAGDPFLVYPGPDGVPWPSIRSRVFTEAMNDIRLCQLARERAGAHAVAAIIDPTGDLSLARYSLDPDHYRRVRAHLVSLLPP